MRLVFSVLAACIGGAHASTWTTFREEGCGIDTLQDWTQKRGGVQTNIKWSRAVHPFAVGVCHDFADQGPTEYRTVRGDGPEVSTKFQYTYGEQCSEYGSATMWHIGKGHKDCVIDESKSNTIGTDGAYMKWTGIASYCYAPNEKHCKGAGDDQDKDNFCLYTKIDCNPNNASVAGIILGSVGLALSLAAVGLAVMASSKKGGGAKPAKPAAPAAPSDGEQVGAATEA